MTAFESGRRRMLAGLGGLALAARVGPASAAEIIMIYFDVGKAVLPNSAKDLVALIAKILKPGGRVTVAGHCDTAEKDAARLSLARAMEVQRAVVMAGAPAGVAYTAVGRGAATPQRQTGPNVSEARNRFVAVTVE